MSAERNCATDKVLFSFILFFSLVLAFPSIGYAQISFKEAFERHNVIMLLINPQSGAIVDANNAASQFYGYPLDSLRSMSIQQINALTSEQVAKERIAAQKEGRNYFFFRHKIADGSVRTVEVSSVPVTDNKQKLLFSIIRDISDNRSLNTGLWHYQSKLEEMVDIQTEELSEKSLQVISIMGLSIAILIGLLILLTIANKKGQAARRRAEEKEATLNSIFDNITDAIIYTSPERNIVSMNKSVKKIFGYTEKELQDKNASLLYVNKEDYEYQGTIRFTPGVKQRTELYEMPYKRKDGEHFIGETMGSYIEGPSGETLGYIGVIRDITERKKTEDELRMAASVFRNASEGIIITCADGRILDVNSAYTSITGYEREEAIGRNPNFMGSGFQNDSFYKVMWKRLRDSGHWQGEIVNRHKNGHNFIEQLSVNAIRDAQGNIQRYIGLFYDITSQKEHEKQLHHIAHYDALTELPNRLLLADRLQQGMLHAGRQGDYLAVVYIDLDGFKEVNDTYGHDIGDELLVNVSLRMKQILREGDTIARLGGDEFVAVLTDLPDTDACIPLLNRILETISQEVNIDDTVFYVTASLGVALYPQEETEPDQLLRQADQAMYQAKLMNKNCYHFYNPDHDRNLKGHHERIERLEQALDNDEFVLYYQPKVNMRTGETVGVEALIRWQHPEKGLLPPAAFLPEIENHNLDIKVGEWVIKTALNQLAEWAHAGIEFEVSVNVSAYQLQQDDFPYHLKTLLDAYPTINPNDFELEILESSAIEDLHQVSQTISRCSNIGVKFALDDFGTGYSSLNYLKLLPAEVLKIDRSFVNDMLNSADDMAILKGILGLAEAFQRSLVAEGVETTEQGEALLQLGFEIAQGYVIARPMPAAEVREWVSTWTPPAVWVN